MTMLLYITKVIIASGILLGYYWFFLRNKKFHHYNRFYLLAAMIFPPVISLFSIAVFSDPDNTVREALYQTVTTLSADPLYQDNSLNVSSIISGPGWHSLVIPGYLLVCGGILFVLGRTLIYILNLRRKYPFEAINRLKVYNTVEPGTPFSFFQSVFWNRELLLDSKEGQQIFRHELFHVQQKHSADILFAELLTAVFWINPFYHLIKKELRAIHEFLADQYAANNEDSFEYAQLLLQNILKTKTLSGSNYFFQNHIKRRIAMITKFKNKKYGYWSRLMVLPMAVLLFCVVALYAGQFPAPSSFSWQSPVQNREISNLTDTIPAEVRKKRKAELDELQTRKVQLQKNHQDEMDVIRYKQLLLLEKLGKEKSDQDSLLIKQKKILLEQEMMERTFSKEQMEKITAEEISALKQGLQLQEKVSGKEKIMEMQHLKLSLEKQQDFQLQQNKYLQEKIQLLKESQLNKTSQQKWQEEYRKDLLDNIGQKKKEELQKQQLYKEQLYSFIEQKKRVLLEENNEIQEKQLRLYKEKIMLVSEDSLRIQVLHQFLSNLKYPEELLKAQQEGFVYLSLALNEKAELTDFVIYPDEPISHGNKIQEIIVTALSPKGAAALPKKAEFQAIFNAEVERVVKNYVSNNPSASTKPEKLFFKIVFRLEKSSTDRLMPKKPE